MPEKELDETLARHFNPVVRRAQAAILWERLWPKTLPSLCVGGLFAAASWLDVWSRLPPQGRAAGVALTAIAAAAPFVAVKTGNFLVTEAEAVRRLDDNTGIPQRPASILYGAIDPGSPALTKELWAFDRQRAWEQYGEKFRAGKPNPGISPRLYAASIGIAVAALVTGGMAGDRKAERIMTAFNWSATPQTGVAETPAPLPPLQVTALVEPPENFDEPVIKLSGENRNEKLATHKNSTLTILTFEKGVGVSVNGKSIDTQNILYIDESDPKKQTARYEILLDGIAADIEVKNDRQKLRWFVEITPDNAPRASIKSAKAGDDKTVTLEYAAEDDHAVVSGKAILQPLRDQSPDATPLPSSELPVITLPVPATAPR